ncbi:hypothetical protein [Paraliomyxa miuraensis]|uniref:hypothetical protein n=1 Tax=Paraliomyxa miuraensis TaxID=376150 RepID=UPI00225BCE06|nr:hypothetical protein [Paraliomyxa miuraensis]MCX4244983.1 hypothetical protein [Paraliomyxa miuraensis]
MTTISALALTALAMLGPGCTPNADGESAETGNDDTTGTATEADTADGSSGTPACAAEPNTQVAWTRDGVLMEPMTLGDADVLGIQVARSGADEMGTVTVEVTTTCEGPLYLWALVWDESAGDEPNNADSLYLSVDGSEETTWLYGCSTVADYTWWWLPVQTWAGNGCTHTPLWYEVEAGTHSIVVRNREGGVGGTDVAAIAGIVVSHDAGIDPSQFLPLGEEE